MQNLADQIRAELAALPRPSMAEMVRQRRAEKRARLQKSRPVGRCERHWCRQIDRNMRARIRLAAQMYDERTARGEGQRTGPLGLIALQLLNYLLNLNVYSPRLEPSIEYLANKLRHAPSTIVRALAALRDHNFIRWIRRYRETQNAGKGPQIQQATNAYRVHLPTQAAALLPKDRPADPGHTRHPAPAHVVQAIERLGRTIRKKHDT